MRLAYRPLLVGGCALILAACGGISLPEFGGASHAAVADEIAAPAAVPPESQAETQAEPPAPAAAPDWPQATSDVPADDSVIFGRLPSGMRYAILRNATPPEQVSLRLHIRAGSLMEREDQLGLAHFMEHMAFNGSTNFAEGELIRTLERLGLAFGPDTNAFTSFDQTVYQLDLPRADEATLDTALRVFRDMAGEAAMTAEAIDRERGIVISEERTRDTPGLRAARARYAFQMPGQLLPDRFPIGDTSILSSAPRERFVDFYNAYYRPERATLVAVGDFDPAEIEARIQGAFSDWTNPAPDGPEPDLGAVAEREAEARIFVDPGAQSSLQVAWTSPPDLEPDHLEQRRLDMIRSLGFAVLNRRLTRLARSEAPPFVSASAGRSTNYDSIDTASIYAGVRPGQWPAALAAIDQEQRRIIQFGITEAELRREITERRASYETYVAGAGTRRTPALADRLAASAHGDYVFTSPQTDLLIFESVVDGLTADEVSAALVEAFQGQGPLLFLTGPSPVEGGEAAVMAALAQSRAVQVSAPEAEDAPEWPYTDFGPAGAVEDQHDILDLNTAVVRFANGVRLVVKPTNFRNDQILIAVNVGGGTTSLAPDHSSPMWAAGSTLIEGGLGRLTTEQIQEALAANVYRSTFSTTEDSFRFSGATRPADFEVQMQVLAAYLTDPAWRPEAFERIRGVYAQAFDQIRATPGGVFSREGTALLRSGDPRWTFPTPGQVETARLDDLRALLTDRLSAGPVEITIVGDVSVETATAVVGAAFGALPARAEEDERHVDVRFPAPTPEPVRLRHAGRADQAMAFVAWPAVDREDIREARLVSLLAGVMRLRMLEELRENQAVTYSPSAGAVASRAFPGYGYISAAIEAPPDRLDGFFADVDAIAADLAARPIDADELDRARRPELERLYRGRNTNEFWLSVLQGLTEDEASRLASIRSAEADLERITPADIQRAAGRYLRPDAAWRVTVTPEPED